MSELSANPAFVLRRLAERTDEALLAELRRVAAIEPTQALTVNLFKQHSGLSRKIYNQRFGSWGAALAAAGLSERSSGKHVVMGAHQSLKMSNDEVLQSLRDLAERIGCAELTTTQVREYLPFSAATLRARWGSTKAAFEAAGLKSSSKARRYTDAECFQNLITVWTYYGRPPKYLEMAMPPSTVGGKAYTKRFGSWLHALSAFVDKANGDTLPIAAEEVVLTEARTGMGAPARQLRRIPSESRDVPMGLRFLVLHRDRFKCTLCGDHPARSLDCLLHVDHILPWSKGGKTVVENLRTLCSVCNMGRSNRFND